MSHVARESNGICLSGHFPMRLVDGRCSARFFLYPHNSSPFAMENARLVDDFPILDLEFPASHWTAGDSYQICLVIHRHTPNLQ